MQILKQFCEYRTGSNILKILINDYIPDCVVYPNKYSHKHSYLNEKKWVADEGNLDIGLLISIKHPYSWIVSRARWTVVDETKFIPSELTIEDIDNKTIKYWCQEYSKKYAHWLNLPFQKILIKYEDLLLDPRKIVDRIGERWNLKVKEGHVGLLPQIVNPGEKPKHQDFDSSYYTEHRYLSELSREKKSIVGENIDWDVIPYFKDKL